MGMDLGNLSLQVIEWKGSLGFGCQVGIGGCGEVGQAVGPRGISRDNVFESARPGVAVCEGCMWHSKKLARCGHNRGEIILRVVGRSLKCRRLGQHSPTFDPWRDKQRGNPDPQPREVKVVGVAARRVSGGRRLWRHNVVIESAVFIICNDKQRLVPLWGRAEGLVNVLHQRLAEGDVVIRVLIVGALAGGDIHPASRVDPGVGRQCPGGGVLEQLG
mmetsp:Transcript_8597/g.25730  ORF Transcript_8597/g.25730 Transcript_8597/m.25730 type:complete len:217 (-) Transcript_8597:694-1344(-)